MKARQVITASLLGFVGVSLAVIAFQATRPAPVSPPAAAPATLTAYYFHGNVRCVTCRKIESYSHTAIHSNFAPEIAAGRLQWRTVNVDEPAHEHFVKDYALTTRSLVLVRPDGTWTNLAAVWDHVGDEAAFTRYVQDSVSAWIPQH